eukprot:TRINITY_DN5845_c0_g4_i2.p1 TRINITY_DN5845_c0_g4~~TRINITY_DN5845_c0_g4_i2.p1  ORF type:complete len:264 (+),score=35.62 TRINITY_DN5845_c0_g4_i2:76-867(+)
MIYLLLIVFTFNIKAQPLEPLCYNPIIPEDPVEARSNDPQKMQDLIEQSMDLLSPRIEDLTIEEAASSLPDVLAEVGYIMLSEGLEAAGGDVSPSFEVLNPDDIILAIFEGLVNSTDGVPILMTMLQDSNNIYLLVQKVYQNFNTTCMDNPNLFFATFLVAVMSELLQPPFRDTVIDIFVTITVQNAKRKGIEDTYVEQLELLIEALESAENAQGILPLVELISGDDALTTALGGFFQPSRCCRRSSASCTQFFRAGTGSFRA